MALIFLVRHGQASFGQQHYDRLSDLGRQQSRWLGTYLRERGLGFSRVMTGELSRQQDTAHEVMAGLGVDLPLAVHAGLNEYDGEALYRAHTDGADPIGHQRQDARGYWRVFRSAYEAWAGGGLPRAAESWSEFGMRIDAALSAAIEGLSRDEAVLVVSSGGVIGRTVATLLGAPNQAAIELNLQCRNASFCEIVASSRGMRLLSYNSIPHLDQVGRRESITHT